MHPHAEKTRQAIEQIRMTRTHVSELLADTPEFQTRAEHVFDTLANGLAFAIGERPAAAEKQASKRPAQQGGRTIMGQPVPDEPTSMASRLRDIQPTTTDMDKLREDVARAYDNFLSLNNKEIRNTLSDLELRGVAKKAGLQVTKTEPAHFTDAIISEIKEAITAKAELEGRVADAEEASRRIVSDPPEEDDDDNEGDSSDVSAPAPPTPPAANKKGKNPDK